ncbi:hypothetical protein F5B18DRAFT_672154 [Nemania serpens]|nr:hypothetical protein F5B18DRAFT_672154 [Nemania serpens]
MVHHSKSSATECMLPPKSKLQSRPGTTRREKVDGDFLDRWSPQTDRDHYHRVWLHRQRKARVARQKQGSRRSSSSMTSQSDSEDAWPLAISSSSSSSSSPSDDIFETPLLSLRTDISPPSSAASSDLGSSFQAELDDYDDKIKSLQPNEWPAVPSPRGQVLRVGDSEFYKQKARDLKQWSLVEGMLYGGHSATLRDSDRAHPKASYRVGVIFSAPHHTASSSEERWVSVSDPHQTATPFGVVHSKFRKMIVIKVFGEHCTCVPIYSHNGRGLDGKEYISEYVSIRDAFDRSPEPPEGVHVRLLAVADPDFRGRIIAGKSSVKLTEFCSHRYAAPATIEGELDGETFSTIRLLKTVKKAGE